MKGYDQAQDFFIMNLRSSASHFYVVIAFGLYCRMSEFVFDELEHPNDSSTGLSPYTLKQNGHKDTKQSSKALIVTNRKASDLSFWIDIVQCELITNS